MEEGGCRMDYENAQIAEIYDVANPLGQDGEFYLSLAGMRQIDVLDLGCGTGTLCCALAERGHRVTGVDPAAAMLNVAKRKVYANRVEWAETTAQSYRSPRRFELIVMMGHTFQCLLTDNEALAALETMRFHLKDGGRVAFETRNPQVDWAGQWDARRRLIRMPSGKEVVETIEVTGKDGEFISFRTLYGIGHTELTASSTLRFSSRVQVEGLLLRSRLVVRDVLGDWDGNGFEADRSREIIFVAQATGLI